MNLRTSFAEQAYLESYQEHAPSLLNVLNFREFETGLPP